MRYDGYMDPQCIPLCDALNWVEGIETTDSCCGHGKNAFCIWFTVKNLKSLIVVGRVFDRRYGGLQNWICVLDNTDTPDQLPIFRIDSTLNKGPKAYKDANIIANNINGHLSDIAFRKLFGV